jgi:hypothetical protein
MKILIERYQQDNRQTIGRFHVLNDNNTIKKTFHCLELPWLDNRRRVSRIPEGEYFAIPHRSPTFGRTLWIQDVPNRSEILVHAGNFNHNTLGCVLVGLDLSYLNADRYIDLKDSKKAMNEIMELVGNLPKIEVIIKEVF